jgi:phage gpG-like protein
MSVDATIINLDEVAAFIKTLPSSIFATFKEETQRALFNADTKIKTGTSLKSRTGNLFKSISISTSGSSFNDFDARLSTNSIYAPIQEYGGTITAKNAYRNVPGGPYLNIPTNNNKTAAGVTRLQAREVFNQGGFIIQYKPFKYGVMLDGKLMFTLHKCVTLEPKLQMEKSVLDEIPTFLQNIRDKIGQ